MRATLICAGLGLAAAVSLGPLGAPLAVAREPVDVLLSFDTEAPGDAAALQRLGLDVPATYFFLGRFAEANADLVRRLAVGNTIGSHAHTHADLTTLRGDALVEELRLGRDVLTRLTGRPPVWFRAPFLTSNPEVERTLAQVGFRYDSSDSDRWPVQSTLLSLPISSSLAADVLASDYDLIHKQKLDTAGIQAWLEARYVEREATGRPLVVLLHPQMIAPHGAALHGFVDFVRNRGGRFRTFDELVAHWTTPAAERRLGVIVDPDSLRADLAIEANKLRGEGVTDVYVRVGHDPSAAKGLVTALRTAGLRVHARLSILDDPSLVTVDPSVAMRDAAGNPSGRWLSPSSEAARAALRARVEKTVAELAVDGVVLADVGYPADSLDYSKEAIERFAASAGIDNVEEARSLAERGVEAWMSWRQLEIADLVADLAAAARGATTRALEVSAAVNGAAMLHYVERHAVGQDPGRIGGGVDTLLLETAADPDIVERATFLARSQLGARGLIVAPIGDAGALAAVAEAAGRHASGIAVTSPAPELLGEVRRALRRFEATAPAAVEAPGSALSEQPAAVTAPALFVERIGRWVADAKLVIGTERRWWPAAFGALGLFAAAALVRRWMRPVAHPAQTAAGSLQAHASGELFAEIDRLADCVGDQVTGAELRQVGDLLRRFGHQRVERYRLVFLLELLEQHASRPVGDLAVLDRVAGWNGLWLRYVEQAALLQLISLSGGVAALTVDGRRAIEKARAEGYDRRLWHWVEQMLHETLRVECPVCGDGILTRWVGTSVRCGSCGASSSAEALPSALRLRPPAPALAA